MKLHFQLELRLDDEISEIPLSTIGGSAQRHEGGIHGVTYFIYIDSECWANCWQTNRVDYRLKKLK